MIDYIYSDGSRGHEFEIGDAVVAMREEYTLNGSPLDIIGMKGVVVGLEKYNKDSTYTTTFVIVKLNNGTLSKQLMFYPDCEPRKEIIMLTDIN